MEKIFKIYRKSYTSRTTIGELFIPDNKTRFCYSLEDTVRAHGIKVYGETAIPSGMYNLSVSLSNRFKREMPCLDTEGDKVTVDNGGIKFSGVRLHGGNDHEDSHGCPLVAYRKINEDMIQGTAEKELTAEIKRLEEEGHTCFLQVLNEQQEK